MRTFLSAGSDVATFAIFDPAAIGKGDVDPKNPHESQEGLAAAGKALLYSYASDGDADILILVEEEPEEEWLQRLESRVDNILLKVPSGRLVAAGYEIFYQGDDVSFDPGSFEVRMGEETAMPKGNYRVSAMEVNWGETVEDEIVKRAIPKDRYLEGCFGPATGCVLFCTVLVLPAVLWITWSESSFSTALKVLMYAGIFHLVFWAIAIPVVRSRGWGRMMELRKTLNQEYPSVVVCLNRIEGEADETVYTPGKFGCGFADDDH